MRRSALEARNNHGQDCRDISRRNTADCLRCCPFDVFMRIVEFAEHCAQEPVYTCGTSSETEPTITSLVPKPEMSMCRPISPMAAMETS